MPRLALCAFAVATLTACGSTAQVAVGPGSTDGLGGGGSQQATASPDGLGPAATGIGTAPGDGGTAAPGAGPGVTAPVGSSPPVGVRPGATAGSAAVGSGSYSAIPLTGRGWDRTSIVVGVTTQKDAQAVAESLNLNSVDAGDQEGDVQAVLKEINARGGLFGRKVVPLFFDAKTTEDGEAQGQAACSFYTQDNKVVAVYQLALVGDTPSFRSCMAKAKVPVLAGGGQAFDDQVFRELGGYYTLVPLPSWTRFAPAFVDRLVAQRYFTGWDPNLGQPGAAPAKASFLCPDTPIGRRVGALITRELTRVGHAPAEPTYYSTTNADVSGYVLRFKTIGVTHVLFCDLGLFVFATQAETQGYRPRYGVSTFNTPVLFLQGTVPDAQLRGAIGSGFVPTLDVDDARDPGPKALPESAKCLATAAKHGVTYAPERRFARAVLYDTCDVLHLVAAAAVAGGGLTPEAMLRGLAVAGARHRPAVTFSSGLSATAHGMPSSTRDLAWGDDCRCFAYRGPIHPMG